MSKNTRFIVEVTIVLWLAGAAVSTFNAAAHSEPRKPQFLTTCTIRGTSRPDTLYGTDRRNVVCGLGGNDTIDPNGARDLVRGGRGDDFIDTSADGRRDRVRAGGGVKDFCIADVGDRVQGCEHVTKV